MHSLVIYDIVCMYLREYLIDEASDLEACKLLTRNAKNLTSAISEALYHTQSASIRVAMATRKELGLTPITGKLCECSKVSVAIAKPMFERLP